MIARIWHEIVPVSKADKYLDLMRRIALPEYLATRGNRGAWCLHRTEADVTHFEMLTFWDNIDAIKRFAGDDFSLMYRKNKNPFSQENSDPSPVYGCRQKGARGRERLLFTREHTKAKVHPG
jgi:hypothetical protein